MIVLGLSGALKHDPSAALLVDGEVVAAAEEERFTRDKHAKNTPPLQSAQFCLQQAGVTPHEIDYVAFPFAPIPLTSRARWHYARRYWYAPDRALDALFNGNRRFREHRKEVRELGMQMGVDWQRTQFVPVEHHLSHASSAYHLAPFDGDCAILGVDGKGEYATTFLGYGEGGNIHTLKEFYDPDSLGGAYGALTEYLGFEMLDGEYKVMGMAPYGDPERYDFSRLIRPKGRGFEVDTTYINTLGVRRYKEDGKGFFFSPKLVEWLGPRRVGDVADEPYVHYAASIQKLFEDWVLKLVDHYLADKIADTGRLAFAGGGALNVKLNQKLLARGDIKELFVQPASGDSGTALGAATYVSQQVAQQESAQQKTIKSGANAPARYIKPLQHVYLGPSYSNDDCEAAIEACSAATAHTCEWVRMSDPVNETADLLSEGHPVAWFHGRMEFGPRALGGRSILGCPNAPGIADRINEQIKFRERWRPFCPSMLDRVAADILQSEHPAPYMTITFEVNPEWHERIPEVVHEDGTARAQVVDAHSNPRYYALLEAMEARTGNGVLLNTSLNRRGEPMVCSPDDALAMFFGCDLQYLVLEDWLIKKRSG